MKSILSLLLFFAFALTALAQNGDISGKVTDERSLPFATINSVDSMGTVLGKDVRTDADGNYTIKPLRPGKYNLRYSYKGYVSSTTKGIIVNADKSTFVDAKLQPDRNIQPDTGKHKKKKRG